MKRIIVASQIIIIAIVIVKVIFLTEFFQKFPFFSTLPFNNSGQAIAQTTGNKAGFPIRDVTDDGLQEERDLVKILQKKQKELDAKEVAVKAEEERILALKKEIIEKIDLLKALNAELGPKIDAEQSANAKRFKDLAKIYEATPSPKAAAMLEKLETATAAGISMNMKRDRAGLVWGFLSPQKAVEITREIAKRSKKPIE